MRIKKLVVGQLRTNCCLVIDEESSEALIVDPGDDADYIMRVIGDEDLKPMKIVATHGHFDHILAAQELKLGYKIPFLVHQKDEFLVKRARKSAEKFLGVDMEVKVTVDGNIKGGDKIKVGESELQVIETPGHTPGSVCLYDKKEGILLAGDLIFAGGGVGRTDFSYSSERDLQASIKKILKLPGETVVYCGHGEEMKINDRK